jgi:hypothetical protein
MVEPDKSCRATISPAHLGASIYHHQTIPVTSRRYTIPKTNIHAKCVTDGWNMGFRSTVTALDVNKIADGEWRFSKVCNNTPLRCLLEDWLIKDATVPKQFVQFLRTEMANLGRSRVRNKLWRKSMSAGGDRVGRRLSVMAEAGTKGKGLVPRRQGKGLTREGRIVKIKGSWGWSGCAGDDTVMSIININAEGRVA